jgi:hypothetical protein
MNKLNTAVAVYSNHAAAEEAVKELQKSGFDMKKLSIVGKDYHTEEDVVGYYNAGDRMKYWGKWGHSGAVSGACSLARPSSRSQGSDLWSSRVL